MDHFTHNIYAWIIFSVLIIAFSAIRGLYYREFKKRKSMSKAEMKIIKLPEVFSQKEIEFIEEWYSEKGMQQLRQVNGKEFKLLKDKPPVSGCRYVNVSAIKVLVVRRNNTDLKPYQEQILKTVKLLVLDAWIK